MEVVGSKFWEEKRHYKFCEVICVIARPAADTYSV